jgi:choline dehydrogenase-like flavoprotein
MRTVVIGGGALDSILAGHLARAGQPVTSVDRGQANGRSRQNSLYGAELNAGSRRGLSSGGTWSDCQFANLISIRFRFGQQP